MQSRQLLAVNNFDRASYSVQRYPRTLSNEDETGRDGTRRNETRRRVAPGISVPRVVKSHLVVGDTVLGEQLLEYGVRKTEEGNGSVGNQPRFR